MQPTLPSRRIASAFTTHPAATQSNHLPFDHLNKRAFKYKLGVFSAIAFSVPSLAIWWRWHRPGGIKNP